MADRFLNLSNVEREEALGVAASNSGRPAHLLEKDVWVVWCLSALFASPLGEHLVFKGGTSLSKVYGAIRCRKAEARSNDGPQTSRSAFQSGSNSRFCQRFNSAWPIVN
jgi:hypothetical protein